MTVFTDAVDEFTRVQQKHAWFGASDTEPRNVFYDLIDKAGNGEEATVPTTIEGWQLFLGESGAPGRFARSRHIFSVLQTLYKAAHATMLSDSCFAEASWPWSAR